MDIRKRKPFFRRRISMTESSSSLPNSKQDENNPREDPLAAVEDAERLTSTPNPKSEDNGSNFQEVDIMSLQNMVISDDGSIDLADGTLTLDSPAENTTDHHVADVTSKSRFESSSVTRERTGHVERLERIRRCLSAPQLRIQKEWKRVKTMATNTTRRFRQFISNATMDACGCQTLLAEHDEDSIPYMPSAVYNERFRPDTMLVDEDDDDVSPPDPTAAGPSPGRRLQGIKRLIAGAPPEDPGTDDECNAYIQKLEELGCQYYDGEG